MKDIQKLNYESGYENYLYTGLSGILMKKNHKILSRKIPLKLNSKILEIGGGVSPHYNFAELKSVKEYWVSDNQYLLKNKGLVKDAKLGFTKNFHNAEDDPNYNFFFKNNIKFSRIIASHVWEHLNNPEEVFLRWMDLLQDNGRLDIAIPCDPGMLFRLGQLVGRKKAMKNYNMSYKEIELMLSREHINSAQNLLKIIKFYTRSKPSYFPLKFPFINLNLFIFIKIYKNDLI